LGYHVTILRTVNGTPRPISSSEVQRATASIPGWSFHLARCEASFFEGQEEVITLWLDEGELWSNNPSHEGLAAMIKLAAALGGRVRGDEFETYRTVDEVYDHPDDQPAKAKAGISGHEIARAAKRQGWIMNTSIFLFFAVMAFLVSRCSN
jgi:hypothetical protein